MVHKMEENMIQFIIEFIDFESKTLECMSDIYKMHAY